MWLYLRRFSQTNPERKPIVGLRQCGSGAAGVEFALIFPLLIFLILMAFVCFEVIRRDAFNNRLSGALSDVVSRSETLSRSELDRMLKAVEQSFDQIGNTFGVRISSHIYEQNGSTSLLWSHSYGDVSKAGNFAPLPPGSTGESYILVELMNSYENVLPGLLEYVGQVWMIKSSSASRPRSVGVISLT